MKCWPIDGRGPHRLPGLRFPRREWDDRRRPAGPPPSMEAGGGQGPPGRLRGRGAAEPGDRRAGPRPGIRAAGVFSFMEVAVQNFGPKPVRDVPVLVEADGRAQPAVTIAQIPARARCASGSRSASRRPASTASPPDWRPTRWPPTTPATRSWTSRRPARAAHRRRSRRPGCPLSERRAGPGRTGGHGDQPADRDAAVPEQSPAGAVPRDLLVERRSRSTIRRSLPWRSTSRRAGAWRFSSGNGRRAAGSTAPCTADGKGLFPVPLGAAEELKLDYLQKLPDLEVTKHPHLPGLFRRAKQFSHPGERSPLLHGGADWQPEADPAVQVIARLRNGAPLALERRFGRGRVVAFLTTAAPVWNNWARENPSFVVAMLELQAYLGGQTVGRESCLVGEPLKLPLDGTRYAAQVRFTKPARREKAPGKESAGEGGTLPGEQPEAVRAPAVLRRPLKTTPIARCWWMGPTVLTAGWRSLWRRPTLPAFTRPCSSRKRARRRSAATRSTSSPTKETSRRSGFPNWPSG